MWTSPVIESGWIAPGVPGAPPRKSDLLRTCVRALFRGAAGRSLAVAALIAALLLRVVPAGEAWLVFHVLVILTAALMTLVVEEFLHAVAALQWGGPTAFRGVLARRRKLLGVPVPLFIGVVYAAELDVRGRARVAAAGACGAVLVMLVPASTLAIALGNAWYLCLALVGAINLLPLRHLLAGTLSTDGDALLDAKQRLDLNGAQMALLCWDAAWRAIVDPLDADRASVAALLPHDLERRS